MNAAPILAAGLRTLEAAGPVARPEAASVGEERFGDVLEGFIEDALATDQDGVSDHDEDNAPAEDADTQQRAEAALMALCTLPRDQKAGEAAAGPPPVEAGRAAASLLVSAFAPANDDLRLAPARFEGEDPAPSDEGAELPVVAEERKLPRITVETGRAHIEFSAPDPDQPGAETSAEPPAEPDIVASAPAPVAADPAPQVPPAQQIIAHLTAQLVPSPQPATSASPARAVRTPESPGMPGGVMALRFTLQPEDLGEVEVTLRRAGQDTKVTISVAAAAAAETLGRDLTLLEDKLGALLAAGSAQSVTVTLQSPEPQAGQSWQGGSGQGSGEAALAGGRGSGRDGRPEPEQPHAKLNMPRHDADEDDPAPRTAAGRLRVV